jgi:choline dehydrogenase-like flavoprotein
MVTIDVCASCATVRTSLEGALHMASTIPDAVGVRVLEAMRGKLTRRSNGAVEDFSFSTTQVIASLNLFQQGAHVCQASGGTVQWRDGLFPRKFPITGGTIEMFRPTTPSRREQEFEFNLDFTGPGGAPYRLTGFKQLRADGAVQALDALHDLSTLLSVTVRDLSRNEVISEGELHVGLPDLMDQLGSLDFTGVASPAERRLAQQNFFAFMNGSLAEVYSVVPLFFAQSRSILWHQHLLVALLLDVFIPGQKAASPAEVIEQLERYLANSSIDLSEVLSAVVRLAGDDLSRIDPTWLRATVRDLLTQPVNDVVSKALRDALHSAHVMLVAAYYACPSVDSSIGYRRSPTAPAPVTTPLKVLQKPVGQYDVLIAGSGVAGALLAHRLAKAGKRVCLLEAGRHHPEASFSSSELDGFSRTYAMGGLQNALDVGRPRVPPHRWRNITVLQARAVGGGGLINNTVCFRLPKPVFQRWANVGFPVDEATLNGAYDAVAAELGIIPVGQALASGARLNPAVRYVEQAWGPVKQHPAALPNVPGLYECNVNMAPAACRGCGYCNIGCTFAAKRNNLQVHLAEGVATGNLDIIELARLHRVQVSGTQVTGAEVVLGADATPLTVKAKQYVVSCGPIQSSAVLLRSGLAHRLIGRRLSANIGAPVFAFLQEPIESFGSVQISHFYWPNEPGPRFAIESWFNPPAAHAMVLPGYLEVHQARMQNYRNFAVVAPLVGTLASGTVDADGKVELPIGLDDLARVHAGHGVIARALMDSRNPEPINDLVMPTRHGFVVSDANQLSQYETQLTDLREIVVGTGHPQGGNGMSTDDAIGPVGADFRVRGMDNLRVCDGSLFPDCAGINPQWTIMALAQLCGEHMATL